MIEIIIAVLLQLATLGGGETDKQKPDNADKQNGKNKTEKPITGSGGSGTYDEG